MADDKANKGPRDQARVSAEERYEVEYLMRSRLVTRERALELIAKHKGSRAKIDQELRLELAEG